MLLIFVHLNAQTPGVGAVTDKIIPNRVAARTPSTDILTMGLSVSSEYDDNFLSDNTNQQQSLMTVVEPHFAWDWSQGRVRWLVETRNGFSTSSQSPVYRSRSHVIDATLRVRQTKRLTITLTNNFLKSTNPFDFFRAAESTSGVATGAPRRPGDFVLASTASTRSERAVADLSYALGAHDRVGLSGSFFSVKHSLAGSDQGLPQLIGDETSLGMRVFYARQLARHQGMDLAYGFEKLSAGNGSSLVHSVLYTQTVSFSSTSMLSVFTGPELAQTLSPSGVPKPLLNTNPTRFTSWHWAGGGTYSRKLQRSLITLGFTRSIGNGTGLLGAVRLTTLTAAWNRQIARGWTADLNASYDHEMTLGTVNNKLSFLWASAGLTHALSRDLSLAFKYWRVHQAAANPAIRNALADHNRVAVTLAYDRKAGVGR